MKYSLPTTLAGCAAVALFAVPAHAATLPLDQAPANIDTQPTTSTGSANVDCSLGSAWGSGLGFGGPSVNLGSVSIGVGTAPSCPLIPVQPINLGSGYIALT